MMYHGNDTESMHCQYRVTEPVRLDGTSGDHLIQLSPKVGSLQWVTKEIIQVGLEYLQRRRLHNLSGQPVPVLCHPQCKEVLQICVKLPVFQFLAVAPCPIATHHWKVSGFI